MFCPFARCSFRLELRSIAALSLNQTPISTAATPFPANGRGANEWERGGATNKARNQVGRTEGPTDTTTRSRVFSTMEVEGVTTTSRATHDLK